MSDEENFEEEQTFRATCMAERGRVLSGLYAHYCIDWDGLTVDETTVEFSCCNCTFSVDDGPVHARHTFIANGGVFVEEN